ncbi:MAG: ABC transporter permease subunit, partial [Planctomycetota bacterium]
MNGTLARRFRFALKELRETLRDRRTIVTLLLMPVLVYPLLSMAMNRFLLGGASAEEALRIGLESEVDAEFLSQLLSAPESQPPDAVLKASGGDKAEFALFVHDESVGSYVNETALFHGDIDVLVSRSDAEDGNGLALIADKGSPRSLGARRVLVERLQWYLLGRASNYAPPAPLSLNVVDVGEPDKTSLVATIVPLVLVLMTITGAVYPAIDLTAGERERGTMEALMASPAPRFELLLSKYIAVVVVATLTAMVNLLAMWVTLWGGGLLEAFGGASLSIGSMFGVLGLLICFSGFFSAVLLTLTSFARSFKEAQAYLIPIMLLSIAPGLLSLMPGIRLAGV